MSPSHLAVLTAMLVSGALVDMSSSGTAPVADLSEVVDTGIFSKATPSAEVDRRIVATPREASASLRFYSRLIAGVTRNREIPRWIAGIAAIRSKSPVNSDIALKRVGKLVPRGKIWNSTFQVAII
jgi:hypothetical protein